MEKVTYRKTQDGAWVAFGPAHTVQPGCAVTVTKRDGTTKVEFVERIGRPFTVDGVMCVYGYLRAPDLPRGQAIRRMMAQGKVGGRACPLCGARDCPKAWDQRDLCQED